MGLLWVMAVAGCGSSTPASTSGSERLTVSYRGVSMSPPLGWEAVKEQLPLCGAPPGDRTVYIAIAPSPTTACVVKQSSLRFVYLVCPKTTDTPAVGTPTTVISGLQASVQDAGSSSGRLLVWLPTGYPRIFINVPGDPVLASQIVASIRPSGSERC